MVLPFPPPRPPFPVPPSPLGAPSLPLGPGMPPGPFPSGPFPPMGMQPPVGPQPGMGAVPPLPAPMPPPMPEPPLANPDVLGMLIANATDDDLVTLVEEMEPGELDALLLALVGSPHLAERVQDALITLETRDDGPIYPAWVNPKSPKPDWGEIDTQATRSEAYWQSTRDRFGKSLDLYFMRLSGSFRVDQDDEEFERYVSNALHEDTKWAINQVAAIDPRFQLEAPDTEATAAAQEAEDAAHHWRDEHERWHARAGNSDLNYDESFLGAVYGRIVSRRVLNLSESDRPVQADLLDPATCYPCWDKHGLVSMVRVFTTTVAQAIGDYDQGDGKVERLLRTPGKDEKTGKQYACNRFDPLQIIEYWDRWWYAVKCKDGRVLIEPTAHEYGFVPFVYQLMGTGRPAFLRSPGATRVTRSITDADGEWTALDDEDMQDIGLPLFASMERHQAQVEMVGSKLMQIMSTADQPPVYVQQNEVAKAADPAPEIAYGHGDVSLGPSAEDQKLTPLLLSPQASVLQPLFGLQQRDDASARPPESVRGMTAGVATGNAIEGMNESGRDRLTPLLRGREAYLTACAEMDLTLMRDWGHLLGKKGERGSLTVPYRKTRRRDSGAPATFELTPATIRKSGVRITTHLTQLRLQNLPAAMNVMSLGVQNKIPRSWFLETFGISADPMGLMEQWVEEDTILGDDMQPIYRAYNILEWGKNPDGTINPFAIQLAQHILAAEQKQQGPPQPGMGPPGGGSGLPVNTSAMNLAPGNFPQGAVGMGAGAPVTTGAGLPAPMNTLTPLP